MSHDMTGEATVVVATKSNGNITSVHLMPSTKISLGAEIADYIYGMKKIIFVPLFCFLMTSRLRTTTFFAPYGMSCAHKSFNNF